MSKKWLKAMGVLLIAGIFMLIGSHVRWPSDNKLEIAQPVPFSPPVVYQPVQGGGRINVNTATLEELMTLNGVGKGIAQNLIVEREANGDFYFPEDLRAVNGIGEKTLKKIVDSICFE